MGATSPEGSLPPPTRWAACAVPGSGGVSPRAVTRDSPGMAPLRQALVRDGTGRGEVLHPGEGLGDTRGSGTRRRVTGQGSQGWPPSSHGTYKRKGPGELAPVTLPRCHGGVSRRGSGVVGRAGVHPAFHVCKLLRSVWPRPSLRGWCSCRAARPTRIAGSGCLGWPPRRLPCAYLASVGSIQPWMAWVTACWLVPGRAAAGGA